MPHLQHLPDSLERRVDVVCFARSIHPSYALYPLLLAECKAGPLSPQAVEQALGYNAHVGAHFVLLANPQELRLYSPHESLKKTPKKLAFISHLPSYQELVQQAQLFYGS
jgi:Type I restriction enzyme R protein N terminus (HSDR_N)